MQTPVLLGREPGLSQAQAARSLRFRRKFRPRFLVAPTGLNRQRSETGQEAFKDLGRRRAQGARRNGFPPRERAVLRDRKGIGKPSTPERSGIVSLRRAN